MIELFKKFTNNNLKKITNVYQLKYTNSSVSGIGDYIRGCFTLLQIIQHINLYSGKNIVFEMDIRNHPISKYIVSYNNDNINYDNLSIYHNQNLAKTNIGDITILNSYSFVEDFINFFNNLEPYIDNYCAFFCSFEIYDTFTLEHRNIIKSKLLPNMEMTTYINEVMMSLGINKEKYNVIHIRCPDEFSFENENIIDTHYIQKIEKYVRKNITSDENYLLISNNNRVKTHLVNNFENIFTVFNKITHFANENTQTYDSVKDTLLDFYLIGYSNNVTAFSSYGHKTGFSQETCKVFNVPYKYIYVPFIDGDDVSSKMILTNSGRDELFRKYSIWFKIKKILFYFFIVLILVVLLYITVVIHKKNGVIFYKRFE